MTGNFDYFYTESPVGQLSVDDIGNCVILGNDDAANFYILCIKTKYGITRLLEYGPYDDDMCPTHISYTFDQIEYNEGKISKRIYKFLNGAGKNITQAKVVEEDEVEDVMSMLISPLSFYEDMKDGK